MSPSTRPMLQGQGKRGVGMEGVENPFQVAAALSARFNAYIHYFQ